MAKTVSVSYSRPSWEDPSAAYDRGILVKRRLIRLNMRRDNCGSYTPNLSLCQTKLFVAVTRAHLRTFRTVLMEDPGYFGVRGVFIRAGARTVPAPVDDGGI